MIRTSTLALAALTAPILAYAGGWSDIPVGLWLGEELAWAEQLHPEGLAPTTIMENYDTPPRADWCGPAGAMYSPSQSECADYATDLESWVEDFTDTTPAPAHTEPPTYCGGC